MNEKEESLLAILYKQESWITARELSILLNCSPRSIKTYVAKINHIHDNIILSSSHGYHIQSRYLAQSSPVSKEKPQGTTERENYIIKLLLTRKNDYDLDELAGELYISPSTLRQDLQRIRARISKYNLHFRNRKNHISIAGEERDIKRLISSLIYNESTNGVLNLSIAQEYIPNFNINKIKKIVQDSLWANQCFLDDFSLFSFVLHLAIYLQRYQVPSSSDNKQAVPASQSKDAASTSYRVTLDVCRKLEENFNVDFSQEDIDEFSNFISMRLFNKDKSPLEQKSSSFEIDEKVSQLIDKISKRVSEQYGVAIDKRGLYSRFSIHLKNMLIRLNNRIELKNPQTLYIRNTYPYIYDISVFIAKIIEEDTGFTIEDDEIAYIALHMGLVFEEQKVLKDKLAVVLLCPKYYSLDSSLSKKLSTLFFDSIYITDVLTSQDQLKKNMPCDLLISTEQIKTPCDYPYVTISYFLDNDDNLTILNKIQALNKERLQERLESSLKTMFKKEVFFIDTENKLTGMNDVIEYLGGKMIECGYVDANFKQKLYERENLSSSAYSNIAIPHPIDYYSNTSVIGVSIHHHPIKWQINSVNLVFMIAVAKEDLTLFKDIFDYIINVISNPTSFVSVMKAKNYEEFINILLKKNYA